MVEVGVGSGVDYERQFKPLSIKKALTYIGWEGSTNFCNSLRSRYPEARWVCAPLQALPSKSFDIIYARHVLEHQPELQPGLHALLESALHRVFIVWYRPPHTGAAMHDCVDGVHYNTFNRAAVVDAIEVAGWRIHEETTTPGDGNLCWELRRAQ